MSESMTNMARSRRDSAYALGYLPLYFLAVLTAFFRASMLLFFMSASEHANAYSREHLLYQRIDSSETSPSRTASVSATAFFMAFMAPFLSFLDESRTLSASYARALMNGSPAGSFPSAFSLSSLSTVSLTVFRGSLASPDEYWAKERFSMIMYAAEVSQFSARSFTSS